MREVTVIEPKWLAVYAPSFYKEADAGKMTDRKKTMKIEPLYDKYSEPDDWRISRRKF